MTPRELAELADDLEGFLEQMTFGLGRLERRNAMKAYSRGLLLDGERKSMEPIAARIASSPADVVPCRQRLHEAISMAEWDQTEVFRRIAIRVRHELPKVEALVVDDTGIPKKGYHSVGVGRQYSGTLGRVDNCQVIASLHLASEFGGACIGARVYLPRDWTNDPKRLAKAHVPSDVVFLEKWRIVLELIDRAIDAGVAKGLPVLADAAYGDATEFREALIARKLSYVLGVSGTAVVWPPGFTPRPPPARTGRAGRPRTKWQAGDVVPIAISSLADSLPASAWKKVTWREGTRGPQSEYFARVRVRTAHRHSSGEAPGEEQWLLCEKTTRRGHPTTYHLSNLPQNVSLKRLVFIAKIRWRIERDYQELKSELGFDHFEGRGWRGLHHHLALVAAAHAFLTLRRVFSPRSLDVAKVPRRSSAGAAPRDRSLPAVLPRRARASSTDGGVAHVIE